MTTARVTKNGIAAMQVCVPFDWSDDEVEWFANLENPSGVGPWKMRHDGDEALMSAAERVPCAQRELHVHVMLDC